MDRRHRKAIIDTLQEKGINTDNIVELDASMNYEQTDYPDNCLVLYEGDSKYGKRLMRYLTKRKIRYAIGEVMGVLNSHEKTWYFRTNIEYYDGDNRKHMFFDMMVCAIPDDDIKDLPEGWKLIINGDLYTMIDGKIKLTAIHNFNIR